MNDKVFSIDELYNLVNAQDSAMKMSEATGVPGGWYDFAPEEEYNERINNLECGEEKFEEDLTKAALYVSEEFDELVDINADDFGSAEDFLEERRNIQDRITYKISKILKDYCSE